MTPLSQDQIRIIADEAATAAVKAVLVTMGVNANDPEALIALQKDFAHLRGWRVSMDTIQTKGLTAAVGFVVIAVCGAVVMAAKGWAH